MTNIQTRPNSTAIQGAQWGDEGKAKFADKIADEYVEKGLICVDYSVSGGANAGHRIEINQENGQRIAVNLHQLPSGVFNQNVFAILGNNKVINPQGLVYEIGKVKELSGGSIKSSIKVSSTATLALPTHQAFEFALKSTKDVGKGATGQGISPAYADRTLRQELYVKDLIDGKFESFEKHYDYFNQIIGSLGVNMSEVLIPVFTDNKGEKQTVGSKEFFIARLKEYRENLLPFVEDVYDFVKNAWQDSNKYAFLFEMSQGVGIHPTYGVKPDITASDPSFVGIDSSTEGIVNHLEIEHRIGISKLYCSSVGARKLPTQMPEDLANWYRDNFHEFGGTTGRPRDIAFPDLVATAFYAKVSHANEIAISHMDAIKPDTNIKLCTKYLLKSTGQETTYRPYQWWADLIDPQYQEIPAWSPEKISSAKNYDEIPTEAKDYLKLLFKETQCKPVLLGTGPERDQIIRINEL